MSEPRPIYDAATYSSSQVLLYGLPVKAHGGNLNLGGIQLSIEGQLTCRRTAEPTAPLYPALIFGYAYQGHCYELPKPQVMLLPVEGQKIGDDVCDCGYSGKSNYHVWQADQLQVAIAIEINEGRLEDLILASNLPGTGGTTTYRGALQTYRGAMQSYRGAMQSYRGAMQVAHRSGRLTE